MTILACCWIQMHIQKQRQSNLILHNPLKKCQRCWNKAWEKFLKYVSPNYLSKASRTDTVCIPHLSPSNIPQTSSNSTQICAFKESSPLSFWAWSSLLSEKIPWILQYERDKLVWVQFSQYLLGYKQEGLEATDSLIYWRLHRQKMCLLKIDYSLFPTSHFIHTITPTPTQDLHKHLHLK